MFFNWVTIYHGVMANLMREDRAEAMLVMHDDDAFDRWMRDYQIKQDQKGVKPGQKARAMSNEEYLDKYAKIHGDEE